MKQLLIIVLLLSGTVFSETFVLELFDFSQTHNDDKKLVGTSETRMRQVITITRHKKQDEDRTVLRLEVLDTTVNVEQEGEHLNYISDEFQSALDNMPDKRSISLDVDEDRLIATINNISIEGKDLGEEFWHTTLEHGLYTPFSSKPTLTIGTSYFIEWEIVVGSTVGEHDSVKVEWNRRYQSNIEYEVYEYEIPTP